MINSKGGEGRKPVKGINSKGEQKMATTKIQSAKEQFEAMNTEERGDSVSISYSPDSIQMHFGQIGGEEIYLTDEQIATLPSRWIERWEKAKKESEIKDCVLLAGEQTLRITKGSLYFCKQSLWMITQKKARRDSHCGRGCWVIINQNNDELASGNFDKDMAW